MWSVLWKKINSLKEKYAEDKYPWCRARWYHLLFCEWRNRVTDTAQTEHEADPASFQFCKFKSTCTWPQSSKKTKLHCPHLTWFEFCKLDNHKWGLSLKPDTTSDSCRNRSSLVLGWVVTALCTFHGHRAWKHLKQYSSAFAEVKFLFNWGQGALILWSISSWHLKPMNFAGSIGFKWSFRCWWHTTFGTWILAKEVSYPPAPLRLLQGGITFFFALHLILRCHSEGQGAFSKWPLMLTAVSIWIQNQLSESPPSFSGDWGNWGPERSKSSTFVFGVSSRLQLLVWCFQMTCSVGMYTLGCWNLMV